MNKNLLTWIAYRYFRSKKRTGWISFTSWVSVVGIGIGAFALLVTLSVLNGFESEITRRVIDVESHIRVTGNDLTNEDISIVQATLKDENVRDISPFIGKKSILSTNGAEAVVRIKAIDSLALTRLVPKANAIQRGDNSFVSPVSDLPGILLGFRLADQLGLYLGDTVSVINPLSMSGMFDVPIVGQFVLTGVFKLDLFDYDDNLAFIELAEGQNIFDMPGLYSGIDIRFNNYQNIDEIGRKLEKELGPTRYISTWETQHRTLFGAMKLEKYGSFIALSFIILVAIFNLTSSLVMLVMEKIREIGMLQALGLNQKLIRGIFLRLGMLIGSIGLGIGLTFSLVLCLLQQFYRFIPLPSVYFIPYLPMEVHWIDIVAIAVAGILLIFIGTLYPIRQVGKLLPVEAIQYEK
ncbi:MAG: ABC transporter permease [Candidatus Neomarinimicrobiota bacterium]